ncbi:MAG: ATP-binding protein [Candidatus Omnitrophica bacterium]|nr:ATP-binding protein [Candidatus Omnitrophota bacterium]
MTRKYLKRTLELEIKKAARQFPVVVLTGPRQTGKSTLLKKLFPRHHYAELDDPLTRQAIKRDPQLFLENHAPPLVLDEIQESPKILPYIKMWVDANRSKNGQFILTGSQVFPVMAGITESLAGRAALFELLGFSWEELGKKSDSFKACFHQIFKGFYPDPAVHGVQPGNYYSAYLKTYLERDIRQIKSVHDLTVFHNFLELVASRVGSLLNLNEISKESGISHTTARQWLSLLESTRIIYLLRPYFRNISKRVVKSPKIYFTDTGLLSYLLKFGGPEAVAAGPMGGAFFENMVVVELLKEKFHRNKRGELYFYRDSNHNEVDVLIDEGMNKTLIEIKMAKTLRPEHADFLSRFQKKIPHSSAYLVSLCGDRTRLFKNVWAIPWSDAHELLH